MIASASATLIATLGGQPQVVTFALDYLLRRGVSIQEVIVLHLSPPDGRVDVAVQRLQAVFAGERYGERSCRFRALPLRYRGRPMAAIQTMAHAEAARQTVHTLITQLKQQERTLHLSIAGGPRMMALMVLSTAMLQCRHEDRVWHMYTEPAFLAQAKQERLLHDERGDRVWLVEVPLVPWGAYFAPLREGASTPKELFDAQTAWLARTERRRCGAVWASLTERQQDVLRAFTTGLNPQEVAEALCISIKTVDTHKTRILAECKLAWELPPETRLSFHFLREKFRPFLNETPSD